MSAVCNRCGSDIVYPVGTWPVGECPNGCDDSPIGTAAYAPSDPKSPGFHSLHADLWDLREKTR